MTLDRIDPAASTTAAQVSSQLVSSARITGGSDVDAGGAGQVVERAVQGSRRAPHDEGVLAVVLVVATAQPGGAEPEAFVEGDRLAVGAAHLERVLGVGVVDAVQEARDQLGGDAAAALGGVDS